MLGEIKGVCVILYFKSVIRKVFYKRHVFCSIEIKLCKKIYLFCIGRTVCPSFPLDVLSAEQN